MPCEQVRCRDARSMICWQKFGSFQSNFFTQLYQCFQIVNLVDCLSSWYKFVMNNPANITASTRWRVRELYIVRPRISSQPCSVSCIYTYIQSLSSVLTSVWLLHHHHSGRISDPFRTTCSVLRTLLYPRPY